MTFVERSIVPSPENLRFLDCSGTSESYPQFVSGEEYGNSVQ